MTHEWPTGLNRSHLRASGAVLLRCSERDVFPERAQVMHTRADTVPANTNPASHLAAKVSGRHLTGFPAPTADLVASIRRRHFTRHQEAPCRE